MTSQIVLDGVCVCYDDDDDDDDDRSIMLKTIPIITKNHPYCVSKSSLRIRITGGQLQGDETMPKYGQNLKILRLD